MVAPAKQSSIPGGQPVPSDGAVLVVGEDARVRSTLRDKLCQAGFRVDAVRSGSEGLAALQRTRPDLILSDFRRPGALGVRLVGDFHRALQGSEAPIVVMSKKCDTAFKLACFDAGATDYLTRPIDDDELVKRLSLHIGRAKRLRSLREMSLVDELTGIANRRAIVLATKCEIDRAERYERPLSMLLIDVDDFKSVNDSYGHVTGDKVLQTVAGILNQAVRTSDTVGRLGGDEFVLLLPETDELAAMQIANRLSRRIRATAIPGAAINLSASIGIATTRDPKVTVEQLITLADESMYRSKKSRHGLHALK